MYLLPNNTLMMISFILFCIFELIQVSGTSSSLATLLHAEHTSPGNSQYTPPAVETPVPLISDPYHGQHQLFPKTMVIFYKYSSK